MEKKNRIKILVAEDDPNLQLLMVDFLTLCGYEVTYVDNGEDALKEGSSKYFDIFIFDVMMPKMDGFTLASSLRQRKNNTPIIFVTARGLYEDRIKGFKVGCDDYITKPFGTEELKLRIEAIIKRCKRQDVEFSKINIGSYVLDVDNQELIFNGIKQKLTKKETDLLNYLAINANVLLTRENVLKAVWGEDDYFIGRSMDVFITRLRKYLKQDNRLQILNIHGTGFKLEIKE